jgi:glycerol-3-phosphate dehydrogenase (NAD(P)+)
MVLTDAGTDVVLWGHEKEVCDLITRTHENPIYHPGIKLHESVTATHDAAKALDGAQLIVLAVPAQTLRGNLMQWQGLFPSQAIVVSLMKGIELNTAKRMTEVIGEVMGTPPEQLVAVSGPNLAREIAERQPAATTVACVDDQTATRVQQACHTPRFRPYTNTDVVGTELGGAVKNVIALATGIADGLGFGENAKAAVITRGLAETARLGAALGASPATFAGLAGLGDLVATCMSPLSRNRTFGERMGRGESVADIAATTRQVAEGVKSCESIRELARSNDVDMPIVEHVVEVVRGDLTPVDMMHALLSREVKPE